MRKHQRWIYTVVTVIVIISFSFFGASGVIQESADFGKPGFTAVDGSSVSYNDLDAMMRFIATDATDHRQFNGAGLNFLNDGALVKDIFSSGAAVELIRQHPDLFQEELSRKLEREKGFILYKHPELEAISVENTWQYFLPQMKGHFDKLRANSDPLSGDYLQQKISLYLAQKQLSAEHLRQVLRYQQAQYRWLEQDPFLEQGDLSLFGYHTVEDWFGKQFLKLSAAFLINSAKMAEKRGFTVSRNEAYADLLEQNAQSFRESQKQEFSRTNNSIDYFQLQLQALRMDKTQAIECARKVLLARKLFQNEQMQNLVSVFPWKQFQKYALAEKTGTKYLLPAVLELQPQTYPLFETYVQAISDRSLAIEELPLSQKTVSELQELYPELVQQTVSVEMRSATLGEILGTISSKNLLQWQLSDSGWETLTKEYPELSTDKQTFDMRTKKLQSLDEKTRARIDQFSRRKVAENSSDIVKKALEKAPSKQYVWTLPLKGGLSPIEGFASSEELLSHLNSANGLTEKGGRYFLFAVIESKEPLTASFSDTLKTGALKSLTNRILQEHYKKTAAFHQKPFEEVELQVVSSLYSKQINQLTKLYGFDANAQDALKQAAHYRLKPYMEEMRKNLIAGKLELQNSEWSLRQMEFSLSKARSDEQVPIDASLPLLGYSEVALDQAGGLYFYTLNEEETYPPLTSLCEKICDIKKKIGEEMSASLAKKLVQEIQEKKGFVFFGEL